METRITWATAEHANILAMHMRKADELEVFRSSEQTPFEAAHQSLADSEEAWTGFVDGKLACMFGVGVTCKLSGRARPWMLTTEAITLRPRRVLLANRSYITYLKSKYDVLYNMVDAENEVAIKWIEWLGFTLEEPVPFGHLDHPFRHFRMRGNPDV